MTSWQHKGNGERTTCCSWHDINFEDHDETTMATWGHDHITIWWHDEGHIETKLQHENTTILEHEDKSPPPPLLGNMQKS